MDFGICATRQHLPFVCPQQQESLYVAVAELKDIPRIGSKCKFHLPVVVLILAS